LRPLRGAALGLLVLAGACRVERTPQELVDHPTTTGADREQAAAEIQDRLVAMGRALTRGSETEATVALSPAADAYVLGPDQGLTVTGADQIQALLRSLVEGPIDVAVHDVVVSVGPDASVAWFRAAVDVAAPDSTLRPLRMTGVYVRDAGVWQLEQAHLSLPLSAMIPPPSSPPEPAADSAGAGGESGESPSRRGGS
jgi:ketosteroid isomerase-like protein